MSLKKTRFVKGIILAPDTAALDAIEGEIKVDSADGKIKVTLGSSAREIVTNSQTQELTNKTITSPVINTGVSGTAIDTDGTLASNSDTKLASQKAVKTYVDSQIAGKDEASEISYNNTTSGLIAVNVQTAIDEVEGRLQTAEGTLSGHISQATDAHDASAISVIPTGNLAADDVQEALVELQTDVDTRATSSALSAHTGATSNVHGLSGGAVVVGDISPQTLTTKTIDADNNTISNLETDNLKTGVLNTSTTLSGATDTQIPSALATKTYIESIPSTIITSQATFNIANNQSSAANITGLLFNPATFRGIKIEYSIYRQTDTAGSARAQIGQLRFVYNTQAATWYMSDDYAGQDSGVTFSITSAGQIQYTSTDITGTNYVGTLKYSLIKTFGV